MEITKWEDFRSVDQNTIQEFLSTLIQEKKRVKDAEAEIKILKDNVEAKDKLFKEFLLRTNTPEYKTIISADEKFTVTTSTSIDYSKLVLDAFKEIDTFEEYKRVLSALDGFIKVNSTASFDQNDEFGELILDNNGKPKQVKYNIEDTLKMLGWYDDTKKNEYLEKYAIYRQMSKISKLTKVEKENLKKEIK